MDRETRINRDVAADIDTHYVVLRSGGVVLGSAGWSAGTERPGRPSRWRAGCIKINTRPPTGSGTSSMQSDAPPRLLRSLCKVKITSCLIPDG